MFRIASRISVAALGVVCLLAFAEPASAQKPKSSASKAKSSSVKTKKAPPSVQSRVRSSGSFKPSASPKSASSKSSSSIFRSRPRINVAPQGKGVGPAPSSWAKPPVTKSGGKTFKSGGKTFKSGGSTFGGVKPKVGALGQAGKVKIGPRVYTAPGGSDINAAKAGQRTSSRAELDARFRSNGNGTASAFQGGSEISRIKREVASHPGTSAEGAFRGRPDRDRFDRDFLDRFRERPTARDRELARHRHDRLHRRYERHHPGHTYWSGFWDGYSFGYHRGYHVGFHHAHHFHHHRPHRHYYGTHLVLGHHFGGFGFHHGRWHFAIVIGAPVIVHHTHWYGYSWWDGYGSSLVTWDRYRQVYDESYVFGDGSCVELHIATDDRATYEIKIDPRYYQAEDPGQLYAELWSELSTQGELRIQDLNGAVHIFPAGMIQQIEARPCR